MKVCSFETVPADPVSLEGTEGVSMRVLIGEQDGAPNFVMRQFEVAPGGFTPHHQHPYEHEVYVLQGQGTVIEGDKQRSFHAGDCIYVAPDEVHQFRNTGVDPVRFLCIVPRKDKCTD